MNKRHGVLIAILAFGCCCFFCDKEATKPDKEEPASLDSPSIMSFAEISQLPQGETLYLHVNRQGFDIEIRPVVFDGLYVLAGERLLLCHTVDGFPIGAGDSGSPVATTDGRIVGVLCYGYDFNNTQFEARVIEDVLSVGHGTASLKSSNSKRTFPFHFAAGIRQELLQRLAQTEAGEYLPELHAMEFYSAAAGLNKDFSTEATLKCGSTITIFEIYGDLLLYGATGTASYVTPDSIFAFGHSYGDRSTPVAAPVFLSEMLSFINSGSSSFKNSVPTQQLIGSFVKQDDFGIFIDGKKPVQTFPLLVTLKMPNGDSLFYLHTIANSQSPSLERYLTGMAIGSLAFNKIKTDLYYEAVVANLTMNITTNQGSYELSGSADDVAYWIDYAIFSYIYYDSFIQADDEHFTSYKVLVNIEQQ